jgi:hypothetical protein
MGSCQIVKSVVTKGKHTGTHVGRVAVRSSGSFNVRTSVGLVEGIKAEFCTHIHKKDGYSYA